MPHLAPPEPEAPRRLPDDETQQFVLQTVANHAEALLRTAERHSLCADDAHDAYQRGLEIFMRRASTLDPAYVDRWLHVVVKREAMAVRRGRSELVAPDDLDYELHTSPDAADPADRVLSTDRSARAAEALRRLKPQELRAIWLKAMGHSYDEIAVATGFSRTKVNRCLAEGRKSFLERYAGIEAGDECALWRPVISAMVDGEATPAEVAELRPHVRNCSSCRATLKGLRESERPLAAVLPVGLLSAGLKLGGILERLMPVAGGAGGDPAATAGGLSLLGVGGAKLLGVLAAGAVATAGGGLVVAHEHHRAAHAAAPHRAAPMRATAARTPAPAPHLVPAARAAKAAHTVRAHQAPTKRRHATMAARRLVARTAPSAKRVEFAPAGNESAAPVAPARAAVTPKAPTPEPAAPAPTPSPASPDATSGEFAPQP